MKAVWYLNMVGLKNDWRVARVFVLIKNCEEFHKSIDF